MLRKTKHPTTTDHPRSAPMRPHHRRVVDRLVEQFKDDPTVLALIIGGSIAKGLERDDSDVDILLLVTDAEYQRRLPANDLHYFSMDACDYPGGYVDGKIINLAFLEQVAERGSEPARSAFIGVTLAWSRLPALPALFQRITAYPEQEHIEKIRSFYAQLQAWQWYMGEAEKINDPHLRLRAASELALFGGRMILAHNRILYPYHKWFLTELRRAPQLPPGFIQRIETLLADPGKTTADAFCECVLAFVNWDTPPEGWAARFMHDSEWNWRRGNVPVGDR
jgi:hypothetical protein